MMKLPFVLLIICQICFLHAQEDIVKIDKFDNSAYYLLHETREFENLTLETLRTVLNEHPAICIEFRQTINTLESASTARRRVKKFKKILKKAGLNMGNFQFNSNLMYITDDDADQRSRIQGVIISLEAPCH